MCARVGLDLDEFRDSWVAHVPTEKKLHQLHIDYGPVGLFFVNRCRTIQILVLHEALCALAVKNKLPECGAEDIAINYHAQEKSKSRGIQSVFQVSEQGE